MIRDVPALTRNSCPVRLFAGDMLSAAVVTRESRQAPVHVTGSVRALKCESL